MPAETRYCPTHVVESGTELVSDPVSVELKLFDSRGDRRKPLADATSWNHRPCSGSPFPMRAYAVVVFFAVLVMAWALVRSRRQ